MKYPLISIVVPIYGVEKYIERCVESLLMQSYENIEIVLVDDGSPDRCPEICDMYCEKYPKIQSFHKENGGLSDARNFGVKKSSGEWIIFVDSDDYVEPDYVLDLWNLKCQFNADMAATRTVRQFGENSVRLLKKNIFDNYSLCGKEAIFEIYGYSTIGWAAYGKLYNRQILLKHPFPIGIYEDCACMYRILNDCNVVAMGDYAYNYHYIQRNGSILSSQLEKKHFRIFDICDEFDRFIDEEYPDFSILKVLLRKSAIIQLLNMQNMDWDDFKMIFFKYTALFRKNFNKVFFMKGNSFKSRVIYLIMCTNPIIYKMMQRISDTGKKNSCKRRI